MPAPERGEALVYGLTLDLTPFTVAHSFTLLRSDSPTPATNKSGAQSSALSRSRDAEKTPEAHILWGQNYLLPPFICGKTSPHQEPGSWLQ